MKNFYLISATLLILGISLQAQTWGIFLYPQNKKVLTVNTMCFVSCKSNPVYPPGFPVDDMCLDNCTIH